MRARMRPHLARDVNASAAERFTYPRPAAGAPNLVVIVLDDVGFAQLGPYGGDVATPAVDRLAAEGLRYNRFHVTAMCSPTRAALLTGRNPHRVGMGFLPDIPMGFPGYTGRIPRSAATLPRLLRDAGYSTFAVGKWHLTPRWDQSAAGPFDLWPLGSGFERHYGFLGGDVNQYTPNLVCDNRFVDPPRSPEEGYHLTEDLADQAIRMILDQQQARPGKPFLLYFAPGAMHAPHHVKRRWIDAYRGRFDDGWDAWRDRAVARQQQLGVVPPGTEVPPRPPWVDAWASLPADRRRLFARMQEVFAGFLAHTDAQIGRLLAFLDEMGLSEDTAVVLLSDNGASGEGGPNGSLNEHRFAFGLAEDAGETLEHIADLGGHRAYSHYAWGWAWAGNAPFRLWKRYTWLGGTRTPLIIRWPAGVAEAGAVRPQFCHVVDLMPTLLELAGMDVPRTVDGVDQLDLDGASLTPTFADPDAPTRSSQHFEMVGSRAMLVDGWKAVTDHLPEGAIGERQLVEGSTDFDDDRWALFDTTVDFAEARDLASLEPRRLQRLVEQWWFEAGRNDVLPLSDGLISRVVAMDPGPAPPRGRRTFRPGGGPVADDVAPLLAGGFTVTAHVEGVDRSTAGILCAQGDWINGWALYVLDGRLTYCFNGYGDPQRIVAEEVLPVGAASLRYRYEREPNGGGTGTLSVDGADAGGGTILGDLPFRWQIGGAGLRIGRDAGFPVCDDYRPPFPWSAVLHRVELEGPDLVPPPGDVAEALHHD